MKAESPECFKGQFFSTLSSWWCYCAGISPALATSIVTLPTYCSNLLSASQSGSQSDETCFQIGNHFKLKIGSLAVQELHDWLQDVVSILGHAAGISHIWGSLNLSQDVSHLLNIFLNMRLETTEDEREKLLRDCVYSVHLRMNMCERVPTWQQRPCWDHPWHCWVWLAGLSGYR